MKIETAQLSMKAIREERAELKSRILLMERLRQERQERPSLIAIWEELTRMTPDSAWVTTISYNNDEIKISGLARSASNLISILEDSQFFMSPSFSGPVVLDVKSGKERFSLTTKLERP